MSETVPTLPAEVTVISMQNSTDDVRLSVSTPGPSCRSATRGLFADPRGPVKRTEDLVLGSLLLVLTAPVMAAVAVMIRLDSPGPVLFRQPRVGLDNEVFNILKFRTMHAHLGDLGAAQQTSRGDTRLTRLGAFLRRVSLDELPQLLNVLGGSMSLVGPRPHALGTTIGGVPLEAAVPLYRMRHNVKPGITGLAQIRGNRGQLTTIGKLSRRVDYDIAYGTEWSLRLDIWILWRSLPLLLSDPGAY